jgi:hypothetical protein
MQIVAKICSEESIGEGSVGVVGDHSVEAVCMTRRTMDPHPELLCSPRGSQQCHQTEAFCLGWSPSTAISDGSWPQGMKEAMVASHSAKKDSYRTCELCVWCLAGNSSS